MKNRVTAAPSSTESLSLEKKRTVNNLYLKNMALEVDNNNNNDTKHKKKIIVIAIAEQ